MFWYRFYTFNWLRTFASYLWAIKRRAEWANPVVRREAVKDAAFDDAKEGVAELAEHPAFMQALFHYIELQHVQAADWFTHRFHPLDKARRGVQQFFEKVSAHHAVAKENLAKRLAELADSKARYMV